jgi:L-asparaginase / beta-aspartyl-peptidase
MRLPALPCLRASTIFLLGFAACTAPYPRQVLDLQEDAWNRGDLESFLAEGYLDTPTLTFFGSSEPSVGYQAVLERYRKSYQQGGAEMGELEFSQLDIVYLGDEHALGRGHWQLSFEDGSTTGGWFSLVFVETNEGWRILHDHTSTTEASEVEPNPER